MLMKTVKSLKPSDYNPRTITKDRLESLGRSLEKFGDLSGIVFNRRTGRLVGGHQRAKHLNPDWEITTRRTAKKPYDKTGTVAEGDIRAPWGVLSYREVDWDEATEKAANIAANAAGGMFDDTLLKGMVLDLKAAGMDLGLLSLDSLDDILGKSSKPTDGEDDAPTPSEKPTAKLGEVYTLGQHRLMCGDSTSKKDVHELFGHDTAAMVFTDPPYGVSYEATSGKFDVIEGDRKRDDELVALISNALKRAVDHTNADGAFYIWHASSTREDFVYAMKTAGVIERQYIIWAKPGIVLGHSDYRWAHEPVFYASKCGQKPAFYGDRAQPTVWRATIRSRKGLTTTLGSALVLRTGAGESICLVPSLPKGKKTRTERLEPGQVVAIDANPQGSQVWEVKHDRDYVHPTQKPVELARRAIENSSRAGEVVYDAFGGSGTTLIAAEATKRRALVMELDPRYCDAIIKRWETFTGRKAVKN
jgi:DNA modification methylase